MLEFNRIKERSTYLEGVQITEENLEAVADMVYATEWGTHRYADKKRPPTFWFRSGMLPRSVAGVPNVRPLTHPFGSWLIRRPTLSLGRTFEYRIISNEEFEKNFRDMTKPKKRKK